MKNAKIKVSIVAAVAAFFVITGRLVALPQYWSQGTISGWSAWYYYSGLDDEWMYLYAYNPPHVSDCLYDETSSPVHISGSYNTGSGLAETWTYQSGTDYRTYLVWVGTDSNYYYKYYSIWFVQNEWGWQAIEGTPPLT